jgi:hypothetical protein
VRTTRRVLPAVALAPDVLKAVAKQVLMELRKK